MLIHIMKDHSKKNDITGLSIRVKELSKIIMKGKNSDE